jgi:hypothetical protein
MKTTSLYSGLLILVLLCSCQNKTKKDSQTKLVETTQTPEWTYLFNGTNTDGWRGYNSESLPSSWVVENGTLKSMGTGGDIGGDIVYGLQEFENFELSLEWKISEGGNSGIFYHVQEGEKYSSPYQNAPEFQLIDDIGFSQPLEDWQSLGADYAMYPANPSQKIVKEAGQWNSARILFTPQKTEYWLNGNKVVSFVPWSSDWETRKNTGKWKDYPDYGAFKKGLIGLQDHGSFIWFREIKIKEL